MRILLLFLTLAFLGADCEAAERVPIRVEKAVAGAPITLGVPFPKGTLHSPDHVRVLSTDGREIPSQITEVTTWEPVDPSVKWIWVFFFAEDSEDYVLEYGPDVRRAPLTGPTLRVVNNQRSYGFAEVDTGPLRFRIDNGGNGFFKTVELDLEGDGFEEDDVIATGPAGRGSFLDLLDDAGVDSSHAVVTRTVKEKGSGPLHTILRVEGVYRYGREDNREAPFITRIHAYAGKTYVRVLHTIVYTGVPDKHTPQEGEHAAIATGNGPILDEEMAQQDTGFLEPNDRIRGAGLQLNYHLDDALTYLTTYHGGTWWAPGKTEYYSTEAGGRGELYVLQIGPDVTRKPPVANSTATERIDGFAVRIVADGHTEVEGPRAGGWMDVSDARRGVSVGTRHFFEEYPKEINLDVAGERVQAYIWSPRVEPMNFARASLELDGGMMGNFAEGTAKTTEFFFHFHEATDDRAALTRVAEYFLDPPAPHVDPAWYTASNVYGRMAPYAEHFAEFERGIDYKLAWWRFNQAWEPWYGLIDYGDGKTYYFNDDWHLFTNNEPATDFMWWMAFMRTGKREYYLTAEATSRHTMDVDNIHWPTYPEYVGDTNDALDFFKVQEYPPGTPYLGMGRRHARQHWTALLSAHVWVPGWIASYYLTGNHRGLEVAEETAGYYLRRIFGDHGLTGRRLYLSVWNLAEVYDATKDPRYFEELKDRVDRMLRLAQSPDQGGSLVIDRYGYAQVYVSQGLGAYYRMTGDERVRTALIRHARHVRDLPPLNHEMESYLSSISSLLLGYELSGEPSLLEEAVKRAQVLRTDPLPKAPETYATQRELAEALESVSHLPESESRRGAIWKITNGLRVFGWTHAYNVPYLVYWLEHAEPARVIMSNGRRR
ncbi:hypothetical protein GQ464_018625 [Rhodocaloribacter litoris]|uniref:exo-rhamnogalacturonan lyase family protein n=1 Tax=Rhodocaloribacter litoris TaxID=2558931 RepID=UPI0014215AE7|nr:hypothetical protein [Rhodocaloribacter litoris]QXD15377.1 hypothetical protein GQ464_018625 [Rhodocaloribacter litoris]